jgi:hypothetical protein
MSAIDSQPKPDATMAEVHAQHVRDQIAKLSNIEWMRQINGVWLGDLLRQDIPAALKALEDELAEARRSLNVLANDNARLRTLLGDIMASCGSSVFAFGGHELQERLRDAVTGDNQ